MPCGVARVAAVMVAALLSDLPVSEGVLGGICALGAVALALLAGRVASWRVDPALLAWPLVAMVLVVRTEADVGLVVAAVVGVGGASLVHGTAGRWPAPVLAVVAVLIAVVATPAGPGVAVTVGVAGLVACWAEVGVGRADPTLAALLVAIATAGLFLGVPDTEEVGVALGAAGVLAAIALWYPAAGRAAVAAVPPLVWLVATTTLDRAPLVVGGVALLVLAAPVAVALVIVAARRTGDPAGHPDALRRWSATGLSASSAALIARVGMVRATTSRSVLVAVGASVVVAVVLTVWWRSAQPPASVDAAARADDR